MTKYFSENSIAIFPKKYLNEKNVSILFKVDFLKDENITLTMAGEIEYQVFLNGKLINYGPAKAAHNYHRVDYLRLNHLEDKNRLVIILASYRVNTFDRINQPPFVRFELKGSKGLIAVSNLNTETYLYETRLKKVSRLSYQRSFSEAYNKNFTNDIFYYENHINLPKLDVIECGYGKYIKRNIRFAKLKTFKASLKEKDEVFIDKTKPVFTDRFMFNEGLGLYKVNEWEDISLEIKEGETIGVVGKIGCGKTTLMNALLRLYNLNKGQVFIDNVDIMDYKISSLRNYIAYVPQDNFLFSDTVANNISFSSENMPLDVIEKGAEFSDVASDIAGFKNKYETVSGERGVTLSGGQKQRISIARAYVKNAPIMILDDSVSAVDVKTEETILKNIAEGRKGKTTIVVASRVSTVSHLDKIIVLNDGELEAFASPKELMKISPTYQKMVLLQELEKEVEGGN